jgi:hypothetical protein
VYIAPFVPGRDLGKESDWIPVFDGKGLDREATWAPSGDALYFYSERDGNRCVWLQKLDPKTKRPVGDARDVYHAHGGRASLSELPNNLWSNPAFGGGRMVVSLGEKTGSIWLAEFGPKK